MSAFVVTVEFALKPESLHAFLLLMRENAARSLQDEKGCRYFDVCVPRGGEPFVFLYEVYDHEAAFKTHLETQHFKAFAAATAEMIESRKIALLDLLPPQ